ncbi:uncharacterized protein LOC117581893 isoform X2 [Drosophila guanche]|uniref:Blast:Early endosome antigen 1 n=1 Tax=Drosophila guanche TaxID=7266 RepID=A0A3B0K6Z3_DROGU|nr:uncharacterized protein LOC117581893 isoform X2 [Drosophila guanche]SPP79268.1 blast:Early endosome antigen 1 [Drosophila guanche]
MEEGSDMQVDVCPNPMLHTSEWVVDPYRKGSDSLKIFLAALVRSWRMRGENICQLEEKTEHFRDETKNTVRMSKALKDVELERNGELHLELMMYKRSFYEAQTSIHSLTTDKEKLLHEVECSKRKHDKLQAVADQRQIEICAAIKEQLIDQQRLSQEEQAINRLRRNNADLVTEVTTLRRMQMEYKISEQCLTKELEETNERMSTIQKELNCLQGGMQIWNSNEPQVRLKMELQELSISNDSLQTECKAVFPMPQHVILNALIFFIKIL